MLSSISFRSKPYDFVPCLNLLKVILPVPEVILPPFLGQYSNHENVTIRWLDRSEEQWRENLGSEEEYDSIQLLAAIRVKGDLG
jgi:hypothetical protein